MAISARSLWAANNLLQLFSSLDKGGVWDRIMDAFTDAYGGDVRMIDGTSARIHHSAATLKKATWIIVLDETGKVSLQKSML